ncbi:MAG: hypothetical protein DME75_08025 [Verrucomicrobia bacterium]|nr:MAG: hypothetical protein DME75_08025 [Verrucomicrobiota bacterium]
MPRSVKFSLETFLCLALFCVAADHCADQAGGLRGHNVSDRSSPAERLSRYGIWAGLWGENIANGKTTARAIVLTLIIDDGRPGRPHRKNIFNPNFNYAGAAYGTARALWQRLHD